MNCINCKLDIYISCLYFYNEYNLNLLLCLYKLLPTDLIYSITEMIHHYDGHIIKYIDLDCIKEKNVCTSCFQVGIEKIYHTNYIHSNNHIYYFNCWLDDEYKHSLEQKYIKKRLPKIYNLTKNINEQM